MSYQSPSPPASREYQDKLSLSAAMARLLEGVGGSDMGGIPEVRARAVEKGYVVRYENLDVTSFTHSYELVGDLSANREVLLFHQGNHNWTAQLNKAGSFTTVFKRDDASEMQELERLVKDVRAQLGCSLVAIPSKTTTPSKKTSSDPSGEVELTVYGLRLPRSANSAKQRLEKLGLKGSTIIKVDKSRKGADMRRVVFSHQEAADDAKKLVQTIRETTGADINCSSEGNPVVDGALSARLEGIEKKLDEMLSGWVPQPRAGRRSRNPQTRAAAIESAVDYSLDYSANFPPPPRFTPPPQRPSLRERRGNGAGGWRQPAQRVSWGAMPASPSITPRPQGRDRRCFNFLRTGRCEYGQSCKFEHGSQQSHGRGRREGGRQCHRYLENGWCEYGQFCKFEHGPQRRDGRGRREGRRFEHGAGPGRR